MSASCEQSSIQTNGKDQCDRMVCAVQIENAANLECFIVADCRRAGHFGGRKSSLGIPGALEDLFVHLAVTPLAAGVAAGHVDHD